jgi:hypothetical protein
MTLLALVSVAQAAPADACTRAPVQRLVQRADGGSADRRVAAATELLDRWPACASPSVESWMTDPAAADRAALVIARLDTLPEDLAFTAARLGVRGPPAAIVQPAVWDRARARVRAVLSYDITADGAGL